MLKNVFAALASGIIFFAWGFAFAYGDVKIADGGNGFIGTKYFFCNGIGKPGASQTFADWWFQYAFAATSMTIVSGSLAERVHTYAYIFFAIFMMGFVYPVVVAWTWGGGWLTDLGYIDFAGSGVVHLVGGVAGVTGAIVVGPRLGRFRDARPNK
jgi:Amt family ammonium transporter